MGDIVLAILVLIVVGLVLMAAAAYATRATLRRRNQVVAGVPSPAPIGWLTSSRREAVIHRRLRAAGRRLELLSSNEGLEDVITRLRIELVEIDSHLVTVSRRPKHARRADRREIADHVADIEDLVTVSRRGWKFRTLSRYQVRALISSAITRAARCAVWLVQCVSWRTKSSPSESHDS